MKQIRIVVRTVFVLLLWLAPGVSWGLGSSDISIGEPEYWTKPSQEVFEAEIEISFDSDTASIASIGIPVEIDDSFLTGGDGTVFALDITDWPGGNNISHSTMRLGTDIGSGMTESMQREIQLINHPYLFRYEIQEGYSGNGPQMAVIPIFYDEGDREFKTITGHYALNDFMSYELRIGDEGNLVWEVKIPDEVLGSAIDPDTFSLIETHSTSNDTDLPVSLALVILNSPYMNGSSPDSIHFWDGFRGKINIAIAVDSAGPEASEPPNHHFTAFYTASDAVVYTSDDTLDINDFEKNYDSDEWLDNVQNGIVLLGKESDIPLPESGLSDEYTVHCIDNSASAPVLIGSWTSEGPVARSSISAEGRYRFYIENFDKAGNSTDGEELTVVIDRTVPDAPSGKPTVQQYYNPQLHHIAYDISTEEIPEDKPSLYSAGIDMDYWICINHPQDTGSGIPDYDEYRINDPMGLKPDFSDFSDFSEGIYTVTVSFQDYLGNRSPESEPVSFMIDRTPPPVVSNLSLTGDSVLRQNEQWYALDSSVMLSWDAVDDSGSGLFHYEVQNFLVGADRWNSVPGIDNNLTDTEALINLDTLSASEDSYLFRVIAVDAAGNKAVSDGAGNSAEEISVSRMAPLDSPDFSTPLYIPAAEDSFELSWEEVTWNEVENVSVQYRAFAWRYDYFISLQGQAGSQLDDSITAQMNAAIIQSSTDMPAQYIDGNIPANMSLGVSNKYILILQAVVLNNEGDILATSPVHTSNPFYIPSWDDEPTPEGEAYELEDDEYWWEGIYTRSRSVIVPAGKTLTVMSGADIRISGVGTKIIIEESGGLVVHGVDGYSYDSRTEVYNTTVFRWDPDVASDNPVWDGFIINGEADIGNAIIRDAVRGVFVDTASNIQIVNTTFSNNHLAGIHVLGLGSTSSINRCVFTRNDLYGIKEDSDLRPTYPLYIGNRFIHFSEEGQRDRSYDFYSFIRGVIPEGAMNENAGTDNRIVEIE